MKRLPKIGDSVILNRREYQGGVTVIDLVTLQNGKTVMYVQDKNGYVWSAFKEQLTKD